jgi:8-oxo-dGTP diphosphatase
MERLRKISLAVVQDEEKHVLIVHQVEREEGSGGTLTWRFPAGDVLENQTPEQVAVDETLIQTGYVVEPTQLINEKQHPNFPAYVYYVSCSLKGENQQGKNETETDGFKWVKVQELERYFTSALDDKVKEYLSKN